MKKRKKLILSLTLAPMFFLGCLAALSFLLGDKGRTQQVFSRAEETALEESGTTVSAEQSEERAAEQSTEQSTEQESELPREREHNKKQDRKKKEKKVTLVMVGDMLLHTPVSNSGRRADGSYNYDALFRPVRKDIKKADVAMVNEEVVLAGGISGFPRFNGRFEVGNAIEKAGFDVVLHATNHSMDQGRAGLLTCLRRWKKAHPKIKVTGMYASKKSAKKITIVKKKGIRIALLNYTYGTNGLPLPAGMPYAVNMLSERKVKRDVKKAKKKADFVVVIPHWGTEYRTSPDSYEERWAKTFANLGVDLVIGSHPHVIQPVKWVKGKNGHRTLVYYSLGNFVNSYSSGKKDAYKRYCGGMAKVTLRGIGGGRVEIDDAKFVPLITHWDDSGVITTYKLSRYSGKKARRNRLRRIDYRFSMEKVKQFFKSVIDKKYLSD